MVLDRIILGMDFNAGSVAAAEWTIRNLAPTRELVLVHVIPVDTAGNLDIAGLRAEISRAEWRMLAVVEALRFERLSTTIRIGDPAKRIADMARDTGANLVVVGPHRTFTDQPDTLSSTAERLVECSPVPVLLVAGDSSALAARLLIPLEGDLDPSAFEWAQLLETRFDATMAIVHLTHAGARSRAKDDALPPAGPTPRWRQLTWNRRPEQVFVDAVEGDAADAIRAQAARFESDLVITDHNEGDLLRTARCPVLVTCGTLGKGAPLLGGAGHASTHR